jgi:hypothetical protein
MSFTYEEKGFSDHTNMLISLIISQPLQVRKRQATSLTHFVLGVKKPTDKLVGLIR